MTSISSSENILGGNIPTGAIVNIVPFQTANYGGDEGLAYKSGGGNYRMKKNTRRRRKKKQSYSRRKRRSYGRNRSSYK